MFLFIAPKKAGVAKKSQQKLDREKRNAETMSGENTVQKEGTSDNGGLFANAKNGEDVLKKLQGE